MNGGDGDTVLFEVYLPSTRSRAIGTNSARVPPRAIRKGQ